MTLKERYEHLIREHQEAVDRVWELKDQLNEAYGAWMKEVTGVEPGALVEYEGQRGVFGQWEYNRAPRMTLVKKDGTVGKAIRYITDYARLEVVSKMEITTEEENGQ